MQENNAQKNRFWELEGLRGVAAIIVVAYHYLLAFFALALLGSHSDFTVVQHMRFEDNFYGNPIAVFLSGSFAVAIFFVLSGFVLSIGFFQTGKLEIIKKLAAKRYLRLMLPALGSIMIAFILLSFGLSHAQLAATITGSSWLHDAWNIMPNIFDAIRGGVYGIFAANMGNPYNNALWTMWTEFFGSFIVFGFLALFSSSKYRAVLYVVLFIATFNTWLMAFILGMVLADLYARGAFTQKARKWFVFVPLLVLALFLGGYPRFGNTGTIYRLISPNIPAMDWAMLSLVLGATLLVGLVLGTTQIARVFSNKHVNKMGKYTFSLYLTHLSILYTLTTGLFMLFNKTVGLHYNISAILAIVASIPVICVATIVFEKYIDSQSIKFSSYIGGIILGTVKVPKLDKYRKSFSKK